MAVKNKKKKMAQSKKSSARSTKTNRRLLSSFRRSRFSRNKMLLFIVLFAAVGSYLLFKTFASSNIPAFVERPAVRFREEPKRGLHWAGLKANKKSALCGGKLLEIVKGSGKPIGCTHGPDPAPDGINIKKAVAPIVTGETDSSAPGTPTSTTLAESGSLACDGDGVSGKRIQALYVRASDRPDNYATYASSFQTWTSYVDSIFMESAQQSGSSRRLRFVTDANCKAVVTPVAVSPNGVGDLYNTMTELGQQGYNRTDRVYLIWMDDYTYCGVGTMDNDDSAGTRNANNKGPGYARVDKACWGMTNSREVHEIVHALGGVQFSAPHSNGTGHCTDEYDRMCYEEIGAPVSIVCATIEERHLDCSKDDYFNPNPPAGSYLANHWNTANSGFLISSSDSGGGADTIMPVVTIAKPTEGTSVRTKTPISASATDNTGVLKMEIYIDGIRKSSSNNTSINYSWNASKASAGAHTITVKAYDQAGNIGQSSVIVYK